MSEEQNVSSRPERKYALIRISAGDYLLPDNDGASLWRISSYDGDGHLLWGAWKYRHGHLHRALLDPHLLAEERWDGWVVQQRTRQDAIDAVLA